jgi:dTMP kinase
MRRGAQTDPDRFEGEGLAFHETLRQAFLEIAGEEPERCEVIDATGTQEEVAEAIWRVVNRKLATFLPAEAKAS